MTRANGLVMQSGGCTHVLNRSLYGVASEFARSSDHGTLYGSPHGIEGILQNRFADLSAVSESRWQRIVSAPGAVIGSTRRKLREDDVEQVFEYLDRLDIGYWFVIGGNDSAETGHTIQQKADDIGRELSVVNVPKTIDNDLVLTDHCPGYGSAARFIALAAMGSGRDAEALSGASPISIIEAMGRDAGWLPAASALARRDERDAPHIVCVPEIPIDEDAFVSAVENARARYGFAVAVVPENARTEDGVIGSDGDAWFVDDFGHEYYDGAARHLARLVSKQLGVRARYEKPGTIQRAFPISASRTDMAEAETAGRAAVKAAFAGSRDVIVTLERADGDGYVCGTGLAPLEQVAGRVRTMPAEYLSPRDYFVTPDFLEYLRPLVGLLPEFDRLEW